MFYLCRSETITEADEELLGGDQMAIVKAAHVEMFAARENSGFEEEDWELKKKGLEASPFKMVRVTGT